jgi:hypothetical protein
MWDKIAAFPKWLGSLLGGGGTIKVGKGNQSSTSAASGAGATSISAGRDILYNQPSPATRDPDAEIFAELEEVIPDLMEDLRAHLQAEHNHRTFAATTGSGNVLAWVPGEEPMWRYDEDEMPGILNAMEILTDHGLIKSQKAQFVYRITPKLANYLRKIRQPPTPPA